MRFRLIDILIFALLYIFVSAFPVNLFPIDEMYQLIIQIGLYLLIFGYYIFIIIKNKINVFKFYNWKRLLLFSPFLLACFSNMIATTIDGGYPVIAETNTVILSLSIIINLLIAITEEILFRLFIHSSLIAAGSLKRIFASAGIFALAHLLRIVNVASVADLVSVLIQVVYCFGLGLMLGFIIEYSYSLVGCIFLHFSFNLLNMVLFPYISSTSSMMAFYLTAIVIAVALAIYTFLIYWFVLSRNERYFRE